MFSRYHNCTRCFNAYHKSPGSFVCFLEKAPYILSRAIHASSARTSDACVPPCPCPTKPEDSSSSSSGSRGSGGRVTYKKYNPHPIGDHDAKNMKIGRPMSPHLTIFGPTLPAMTSISQRITGAILTFYAVLLAGGALFLPNGIETYVSMIQSLDLGRICVLFIKLCLGAPFAFHYFNGIRFVLWNVGKFATLKESYKSARLAIIAASVLNFLFAFL